jgi:hypothetical protein
MCVGVLSSLIVAGQMNERGKYANYTEIVQWQLVRGCCRGEKIFKK